MVPLLFFTLLVVSVYFRWLALEVLIIYLMASCIAFCLYGRDKSAARSGKWRTRESTLHIIGFLGGWPGALLAQRIFRHKTRKVSFRIVFWMTALGNCAVLGWLLRPAIMRI